MQSLFAAEPPASPSEKLHEVIQKLSQPDMNQPDANNRELLETGLQAVKEYKAMNWADAAFFLGILWQNNRKKNDMTEYLGAIAVMKKNFAGNAKALSSLTENEVRTIDFVLRDNAKVDAALKEGQKAMREVRNQQTLASMNIWYLAGEKYSFDYDQTQEPKTKEIALDYLNRVLSLAVQWDLGLIAEPFSSESDHDEFYNLYRRAAQRIIIISTPEELRNLALLYGTRVLLVRQNPQLEGMLKNVDPIVARVQKQIIDYLQEQVAVEPADSPTRKNLEATIEYVKQQSLKGIAFPNQDVKETLHR